MYQQRFYRSIMKPEGLVNFTVAVGESDLHISAGIPLEREALKYLVGFRRDIQLYCLKNRDFLTSLVPLEVPHNAPPIVKHMAGASSRAGVGPMAAVAGAISQYVGNQLLKYTDEIIIENGGDIFVKCRGKLKVLIYAGDSPLSNRIALEICPGSTPLGICTSSGTVGHSLSFGRADAVTVAARDTLLADASATAIGNLISTPSDIAKGLDMARSIKGLEGVVIIKKDKLGAWGNIRLIPV